jgi:hypothetical protein
MAGLSGSQAGAQVRTLLKLEHSAYLQFETVNAYVSIFNDSDQPLCLGASASNVFSELTFVVERHRDEWMDAQRPGPILSGIVLDPGEQRDVVIDLSRWYNVSDMGSYHVSAIVRSKGRVVSSSPMVMLNIVRGIELINVERNVPGNDTQVRAYSLRYWNRNRSEYAFLSIDERPSGQNHGLFQLGKIVRYTAPTITVDRGGLVTVRHQCAVDAFIRTTFKSDPDGVRFVDQRYEKEDGTLYPDLPARRQPVTLPAAPR